MQLYIDPVILRNEWNALGDMAGFKPVARPRATRRGAATFRVLTVPRFEEYHTDLYWQTGLCFCARPRFSVYRERLVLIPPEYVFQRQDWPVTRQMIHDLCIWSEHMTHVVTVSTLKSGASVPLSFHAQSFALQQPEYCASALYDLPLRPLIRTGMMPHFESLSVSATIDYPLRGLCLTGNTRDIADKAFELALNYDHLKAFNIVILPARQDKASVHLFFFPRRTDGRAIYPTTATRWQIAGLEANGLLQAKSAAEADAITSETVGEIFATVGLDEGAFARFLILLETF